MGWLRLVGSLKLEVSFAEYHLFYRALLQKRPIILRSLLTKATPYLHRKSSLQKSSFRLKFLFCHRKYWFDNLRSGFCNTKDLSTMHWTVLFFRIWHRKRSLVKTEFPMNIWLYTHERYEYMTIYTWIHDCMNIWLWKHERYEYISIYTYEFMTIYTWVITYTWAINLPLQIAAREFAMGLLYGVAEVCRIDWMIGLLCKRAL